MTLKTLLSKVPLTDVQIRDIFTIIASGGDNNTFDETKLLSALKSLSKNTTIDEVRCWMFEFDSNGDGNINVNEFKTGILALQKLVKTKAKEFEWKTKCMME